MCVATEKCSHSTFRIVECHLYSLHTLFVYWANSITDTVVPWESYSRKHYWLISVCLALTITPFRTLALYCNRCHQVFLLFVPIQFFIFLRNHKLHINRLGNDYCLIKASKEMIITLLLLAFICMWSKSVGSSAYLYCVTATW